MTPEEKLNARVTALTHALGYADIKAGLEIDVVNTAKAYYEFLLDTPEKDPEEGKKVPKVGDTITLTCKVAETYSLDGIDRVLLDVESPSGTYQKFMWISTEML